MTLFLSQSLLYFNFLEHMQRVKLRCQTSPEAPIKMLRIRNSPGSRHWYRPGNHKLLCCNHGGQNTKGTGECRRSSNDALCGGIYKGRWETSWYASQEAGCHERREHSLCHKTSNWKEIWRSWNTERHVSWGNGAHGPVFVRQETEEMDNYSEKALHLAYY